MTASLYLSLLSQARHDELSDWVDLLTHDQRRILRAELERLGCTKLSRNLYFNYETQEWI